MRRKAILGSVLAVVATATTVPMVVSGTAGAQTNARLCGRYWHAVDRVTREEDVVVHFYEVDKGENETCDYAKKTKIGDDLHGIVDTFDPEHSPFRSGILRGGSVDTNTGTFSQVRCEDWKNRPLNEGGLNGLPLVFSGENFPETKDQDDICKNMNRSENLFLMESYWTHWSSRAAADDGSVAVPGTSVTMVRSKN